MKLKEVSTPVKAAVAVAFVAIAAWLAFGFFGIQSAFIDNRVDEANPFATTSAPATQEVAAPSDSQDTTSEAATDSTDTAVDNESQSDDAAETEDPAGEAEEASAPTEPAVQEIVTLASGTLVDHDHAGTGTVNVLTDGATRVLRFEDDFAIDNGPDLNVYLVRGADAEGDPGLFDDDFIDLGDLKGNIGAQNYELPEGIDLAEYNTVAIWCVRFGVAFNAANLS